MFPDPSDHMQGAAPLSPALRAHVLQELAEAAASAANGQLDALTTRLAAALARGAARLADLDEARRTIDAADLLKKNRYPFCYLAAEAVKRLLQREVAPEDEAPACQPAAATLPPEWEVDKTICLRKLGQALEAEHATRLELLGRRLAPLLGAETLPVARNPFRPQVFLLALHEAWCEFHPEADAHPLMYRLMRPDLCLEMDPILHAVDRALARRGIGSPTATSVLHTRAAPATGGFPALIVDDVPPIAAPAQDAAVQADEMRERAGRAARDEVALRLGSGEVVAFIGTFLQDRWVEVLTLAYAEQDERPQALRDAVETMDELLWSVQPKITPAERQELLVRLPPLLVRLNQWLDRIRWHDAERDRFFVELAACHASLMRAPLPVSPTRRVELAIETAIEAAEQRLLPQQAQADALPEPQAASEPETALQPEPEGASRPAPGPDAEALLLQLERGAWVDFTDEQGRSKRVRLAWVSPMRSRYVFSSRAMPEALSLPAAAVALALHEGRMRLLSAAELAGAADADSANAAARGSRPAA